MIVQEVEHSEVGGGCLRILYNKRSLLLSYPFLTRKQTIYLWRAHTQLAPTVRIYRELWKMSTLNPVRGGLKIICLQKEGRGIIISLIPAGRTNYVPRFFQVLTVFISYIFTDAGAQGTM